MRDLIDRADVIKAVNKFFDGAYMEDADVHEQDMLYELSLVPSVEPKWKTGHWIYYKINNTEYRECSNCNVWMLWDMPRNSFCPNCGADMKKIRR